MGKKLSGTLWLGQKACSHKDDIFSQIDDISFNGLTRKRRVAYNDGRLHQMAVVKETII